MELIYNKIFLEHENGAHPENKKRLLSLGDLKETVLEDGEQYVELVHTKDYIDRVREACRVSQPLDTDTVTSPGSFKAATQAASAAVLASQSNGFAIVRPPGHHAYPSRGTGFCLFNNIAIAAQKLANEGKHVAIIDIDGHYGDGTADIFYSSNKVLYCSLHQYPAFPGNGFVDEIGEGKGKGYTINTPLPPASSDDLFLKSISEIFIPIVEQFRPDVVAISAGFDAHIDDPLLQLNVSAAAFYKAGKLFASKFKNLFAVLEGGYNTEALPKCLFNFLDGVNGQEIRFNEEETTSHPGVIDEFEGRIKLLWENLAPFWKF